MLFHDMLVLDQPRTEGPQEILINDAPFTTVPAYFNPAVAPLGRLERASIVVDFVLNLSAGVKKTGPFGSVQDNTYTNIASAFWSWDGTGTINDQLLYKSDPNAGVLLPTTWSFDAVGSQFPANLQLANAASKTVTWPIRSG
jgi:hypothetical protein